MRRERAIGNVVDQILVRESDELLIITSANNVTRIPVSQIRRAGRSTKGVRLVRLAEGDEVLAVANLTQQSKEIAEITGEPAPVPPPLSPATRSRPEITESKCSLSGSIICSTGSDRRA